ncbi:sacsin N-terminal ATP-binding-like domain-containing protein [Paenibacillus polymyxa]|uniref:sacsin N-terminal ATP-binding-like domain-containing protein n=1 Tax=Paenibacillus polymyxa TaxID=1406 RepID=UPI0008FB7EB0|nr:ATP-binding protein [Paenibacillus polymyxa]APB77213.1 HSP90 family protein [Paenibacillus polymyxa]POR30397.1 ATP-binding protein [Paenibacillus polymyxa]
MEFSQKIRNLRNKAQETQAANKIIDMLNDLKMKNNETTSYRWIWELIQNAKDVVNTSGMVDITINFDQANNSVEFTHNGKLFSTENIVFLIEQVSTKDRTITDEKNKKTTGKFGTGFLTTHLLSEKVRVSGYLQDVGEPPCSFKVVLDRSGVDQQSIISAIQESCLQLDKNTTIATDKTIQDKDFNTCFTYDLDESGVSTAKKGLRNLLIAAPYVFAFVPKIGSITVTSGQYIQKISRGKMIETELEDAKVTNVVITTNGETKDKYIFVLGTNDLSVAVEVEQYADNNFITKYDPQLPKIFCDFPLLGTNDFSFPVVVNSPLFNPTEPRNGIHLTDKEHKQIAENKQILMEASQLYIKMVDYFLEKGYERIYNITKISEQLDKDWLSKEWFEQEIINKLKSHITEIPLISTHNGGKMPLKDEWGGTCVFIPKDLDESLRAKVWTLSSQLIPDMITKREELECWYNSFWEECRNYGLLDLINRVEAFENISELSKHLNGNVTNWLNELLALFYLNEYTYINNLGRNPRILPNQYGEFRTLDEVSTDCGIDEIYKDISTVLNLDFRIKLLDREVNSEFLVNIKKITLDDFFSEILKKLHRSHPATEDFYKSIISLQAKQNSEQNDFLDLACELQGKDAWIRNSVSKHSQELLKLALKFWREKITKDISSYESIKILASGFNFISEHEAMMWMTNFVRVLVRYEQEDLLDRIAILPDQYGNFKLRAELSQDSGEIDEILKDASKHAGYDVRKTLLSKDIILDLPENRTVYLENISEKITQYVKENKNSIGQNDIEVKEVFQKTYLWLRENLTNETVKKCFKDLLTNLHWFYNDNDIAENMSKIEKYNDILEKYGVSGVQELEQILSRSNVESSSSKTVEISVELLSQWGISTEEDLNRALANNVFGPEFIHDSKRNSELFSYVQKILERSKKKIIEFLDKQPEYDVSEMMKISNTIFVIKKHDTEIYLITRPSDYGQIILYYDSELDMLDYEKDCELWVEDNESEPQKITFGKILKLTGVNKIPLRSIREK